MSDPDVIALVNRDFVPVWVNVRTTPIPDLACMEEVLGTIEVDGDGVVRGSFSQGYFLRSVVLASDGETLLNRQKSKSSLGDLLTDGDFPYAQVKAPDYGRMLKEALERVRPRIP